MKKVVTIGGGTGQYTLLRGLKNYDIDLTAIAGVVDNGGSSGKLRTEFGILPPGDLRNCLIALSDEAKLKELKELFEYRFPKDGGNLAGHNLGNLILTALTNQHEDIGKAAKIVGDILNISGQALPVSIDNTNIKAKTDKGRLLEGENAVSYPDRDTRIKNIWLEPKAYIYKDAAEAIREADLIIICPGAFYTSILSNFLVEGMEEALKESEAKIVYVCNLVTKQGTHGFRASDFKNEVENYATSIDKVICNTKKPTKKVVDEYKQEDSYFVEPNLEREEVIKEDLLEEFESGEKVIARHNPEKTTKLIMDLV